VPGENPGRGVKAARCLIEEIVWWIKEILHMCTDVTNPFNKDSQEDYHRPFAARLVGWPDTLGGTKSSFPFE
jgi:hypothetical protein